MESQSNASERLSLKVLLAQPEFHHHFPAPPSPRLNLTCLNNHLKWEVKPNLQIFFFQIPSRKECSLFFDLLSLHKNLRLKCKTIKFILISGGSQYIGALCLLIVINFKCQILVLKPKRNVDLFLQAKFSFLGVPWIQTKWRLLKGQNIFGNCNYYASL